MKTIIFLISIFILIVTLQDSRSENTISIRLGTGTGQDAFMVSNFRLVPFPQHPDLAAFAWTVSDEFVISRCLFKFNLTSIPANTIITDAKLSLFGNPNPGNNNHSGLNLTYIRKVTTGWDQNSVTWDAPPDYTTVNQVKLAQSISPLQDYKDIDVTELVSEMVKNPSTNFGFILMLRTESFYRCMNFASSECPDTSKRPLLVISYSLTGINPGNANLPYEYNLSQNFPNPFNPVTNIKFDLPRSSVTVLKIFNELGIEVSTLVNENLNAGSYEVKWDGANYNSGVYFVRLESGNKVLSKKLMLIK